MKQVIAHRGASGLELENSQSAIQLALKQRHVALEIDVRLSRDLKLVVCHDADLIKMADNTSKIANYSWDELKTIQLKDESRLMLLDDVLAMIDDRPIFVELKDLGSEHAILACLQKFPKSKVTIISFKRPVLLAIQKLRPKQRLYVSEHKDAIDAVQFAKRHNFKGITLNFWLLSPHIYWMCRRANLEVLLYTVNNRLLFWFLKRLYPKAGICTDFPNRFK